MSVHEFYHKMKKESLSLGLYIEYLRFICNDWDEIVDAFFIAKDKKNNNFYSQLYQAYNIKFEYFWKFIDLKLFDKTWITTPASHKFSYLATQLKHIYEFGYDKNNMLFKSVESRELSGFHIPLVIASDSRARLWQNLDLDLKKSKNMVACMKIFYNMYYVVHHVMYPMVVR